MYQKKDSLRSTILNNPDAYIGSTEKKTETRWIYDGQTERMVQREVSYAPGLLKIFDELLVNVADHRQRDDSMTSVMVKINAKQNVITVRNNGIGIPVVKHDEEGVYVPELLFGQLSTSSNYGEGVKDTIVGRRGNGAKLTNIFSTEFKIAISDGGGKKNYKQTFRNNMTKRCEPYIKDMKEDKKKDKKTSFENWIEVSFKPDLQRFGMNQLDEDIIDVLSSRVYSFAGSFGNGVRVKLNGKLIGSASFEAYVGLFPSFPSRMIENFVTERERLANKTKKGGKRWEVCVTLSEGQFEQISFVNSVATINGGTHVDHVVTNVTKCIKDILKEKHNNESIVDVKNHLRVFVNALISNPVFDSEKKEKLIHKASNSSSKFRLLEEDWKKVADSGVIERLLSPETPTKRKEGGGKAAKHKKVLIEKLHDAEAIENKCCTLIVTEGDSAKHLVMAGLSSLEVSEKETYGVYPLQGKLINVRKADEDRVERNRELQNIKAIIGLEDRESYTTTDSLRYKHVMIMTDQDEDGDHIKGLLINFFHHNWPQLLELDPPFLSEFRTPIVKVKPVHKDGGGAKKSFYSNIEYTEWKKQQGDKLSEWETRHYKGLGTHTSKEGRKYFKHIANHKRVFVCDPNKDHGKAIDRAFNQESEDRKQLLENFDDTTSHHDGTQGQISFTDFMENNLASFFMANIKRSVPSMLDGLKPGQRKILHCLLKRSSNKNIKVSQLSALVSEHCDYHHSDKSLNNTIIKMAQDHVGSNNMPLLQSLGQFGTRNAGGKDVAHPRYLHTKLSPEARILFPEEDDDYAFTLSLNGEGRKNTEPERYYPIVPIVLVNGCAGIASGWSTSIPNYNLTDVISHLESLISGDKTELISDKTEPMDPWYRGFKGNIKEDNENGYKTSGKLESGNAEARLVTELPIRVWTNSYVDFLEKGKEKRGKVPAFIENYKNRSDATTVSIQIKLKKTKNKMTPEEETEKLRLTRTLRTSNMYLLDETDKIAKYESSQHIIESFYRARLPAYHKRKELKLEELNSELRKLECRFAWVRDVMNGEFRCDIERRSYVELYEEVKKKYEATGGLTDYSFLLDLPFSSCNLETLRALQEASEKIKIKIGEIKTLKPEDVWMIELKKLREVTEISSSASQPMEGQQRREPEGSSMSSKGKRTRSPGSTSGEKESKR